MDEYILEILVISAALYTSPPRFPKPIIFMHRKINVSKFPDTFIDKYFTPENFYTNADNTIIICNILDAIRFNQSRILVLKLFLERFAGDYDLTFIMNYEVLGTYFGNIKYGDKEVYKSIPSNLMQKYFIPENYQIRKFDKSVAN